MSDRPTRLASTAHARSGVTFPRSPAAWVAVALAMLLGLLGFSADSVLIHLSACWCGREATLGLALSVGASNTGTAIGTGFAGTAPHHTARGTSVWMKSSPLKSRGSPVSFAAA